MSATRPMTTFTAGALTLALGAAMVVWPGSARAADDGLPVDTKIMRGIMEGLGLRRDGDTAIDYQERAPLVLPSGRTLPPPEKADAVVKNDPAWPKDADVTRRKRETERERNRNVSDERELESRPLRPDQLTPGGRPSSGQQANSGAPPLERSGEHGGDVLRQSEMGSGRSIFGSLFGGNEPEVGKFTGEPPRASLTAPPRGYQTPSPDQPYGVGQAETKTSTSKDYARDHPTGQQ